MEVEGGGGRLQDKDQKSRGGARVKGEWGKSCFHGVQHWSIQIHHNTREITRAKDAELTKMCIDARRDMEEKLKKERDSQKASLEAAAARWAAASCFIHHLKVIRARGVILGMKKKRLENIHLVFKILRIFTCLPGTRRRHSLSSQWPRRGKPGCRLAFVAVWPEYQLVNTLPVAFTTNRFLGCCKSYRMSASLKQHNLKNISVQYANVESAKIKKTNPNYFRRRALGRRRVLVSLQRSSGCRWRQDWEILHQIQEMLIVLTASIMWRFKCDKKTIGNLVFNHRVRSSRKWQCKSAEVASSSTRCLYWNIRMFFKPIFMTSIVTIQSLSNFRNCLRTTGNTPQYVSVIRYIMISQDTLFVICKLVDKKWQKVKHNKVILSIASSIFPAPEFYLRKRITAISPWQFLSRFCIIKSLERPCIFYFMILSQMVISVRRDTSNSSQLSQPTSRSWLLKSGGEPV